MTSEFQSLGQMLAMPGWTVSAVMSAAASALVVRVGFLTAPAGIVAACFGTILLSLGGWSWAVTVLVGFLLTSMLSRRRDRIERNTPNRLRAKRNTRQIIANASLLPALAVTTTLVDDLGAVQATFLGTASALCGDTWATALGTVSTRRPVLITTFRPVQPGTPGAVSVLGLVAAIVAALVLAFVFIVAEGTMSTPATGGLVLASACGALAGSVADSVLGATCQGRYRSGEGTITDHPFDHNGHPNEFFKGWRWLTNDLVNFVGALTGGAAGFMSWWATNATG